MTWKNRFNLVVLLLLVFALTAVAQEMTKEEWQKQMQELTAKRDELRSRVASLQTDVDNLKKQDADKAAALKKCEDEILAMVGATAASIAAFEAELNRIDRWLDELSRLSNQDLWARSKELDDVQTAINNAKKNKISAIPRHYDRLANQQNRLDGLKKSLASSMMTTYTVGTWSKDRDCLWNIAKKPAVYDNAFLWPKIWQGNKEQIKNPDIIWPGQKLRIPPKAALSAEEKAAERMYWQSKQAAPMN
ncbi:MAG: LysM peptidoglycan-binding domain-containing protein [Bacteroidota bacterium]